MEIETAVKALSALAQESRLEIFRVLVRQGSAGMSAGELGETLSIPAATMSFHLKELTNAGLIDGRRDGRSIIYSLRVEGMRTLLAFLMEDCCQGKPELCDSNATTEPCCSELTTPKRKSRKQPAKK